MGNLESQHFDEPRKRALDTTYGFIVESQHIQHMKEIFGNDSTDHPSSETFAAYRYLMSRECVAGFIPNRADQRLLKESQLVGLLEELVNTDFDNGRAFACPEVRLEYDPATVRKRFPKRRAIQQTPESLPPL